MSIVVEPEWLSASDLSALRARGRRRTARAGSTIFVEGDDPYDVMIVESGDVKIATVAANGGEVVLDVLGAGELLGELSAIDGIDRSATATAITDVELTTVPVEVFWQFLQDHPMSMGALLAVVVRRLRISNRRQLEFSATDAMGRLCARLDELADRDGTAQRDDSVHIELRINQTELAQWCGLSREAVVKALRKLRQLGWLTTGDGTIVIDDREALRRRAHM